MVLEVFSNLKDSMIVYIQGMAKINIYAYKGKLDLLRNILKVASAQHIHVHQAHKSQFFSLKLSHL